MAHVTWDRLYIGIFFRKNTIRDIAVATGANVFDTEEMGLTLEKGQLFDLGEIGEVIVTKVVT